MLDESRQRCVVPAATAQAEIALQTPADKTTFLVLEPITVLRVGWVVMTATTVAIAITGFDRRITPGSDTGRVNDAVGNVQIPIGTAIGKVVYKEVNVDLDPGDQVVVRLVQAATAGGGIPILTYVPRHESMLNIPDGIASV